jgi:hypothetical protein
VTSPNSRNSTPIWVWSSFRIRRRPCLWPEFAWQAPITKGQLKAGEKALIYADSGGVDAFANQIAKHLGALVETG